MAASMLALTACGKEDKLVLVTTEAAASQSYEGGRYSSRA